MKLSVFCEAVKDTVFLLFYTMGILIVPLLSFVLLASSPIVVITMLVVLGVRVFGRIMGCQLLLNRNIIPRRIFPIIFIAGSLIIFLVFKDVIMAMDFAAGVALADLVPDSILLLGYHILGLINGGDPMYYFKKADDSTELNDILL